MAVASDQPSARALERAHAAGVPTRVFLRSEFGARAERDAAIADWLAAEGVELVVLAGYMAILDAGFVARFPDRILNVHPSLLPAFPGVRAIEQAVEHGVKVFGVTVHLVDEGVDTGPIVLQRAVELPDATRSGRGPRAPAPARARPAAARGRPDRRRARAARPGPPAARARGGARRRRPSPRPPPRRPRGRRSRPGPRRRRRRPSSQLARVALAGVGLLAARLRLLAGVVDVVVERLQTLLQLVARALELALPGRSSCGAPCALSPLGAGPRSGWCSPARAL